jgi:hypothetical protein
MSKGKGFLEAKSKVEAGKRYSLQESVALVVGAARVKRWMRPSAWE